MKPKGTRNAGFEERRAELLARMRTRLMLRDAPRPALRELASEAGCSVSTLNHYFGKRDDILIAVFADSGRRGQGQFAATRQAGQDFETSIRDAAAMAWQALTRHGVADALAMGMAEGMRNRQLGPAFIRTMFEPFVIALTERLDVHVARGQMRAVDTRMAALALASPLLLGTLHQSQLGGAHDYPLDGDAFLFHVIESFVRAYRAD
ncbi:TetR/AcrR family transcriptional regulator C-terminal domain-containing protein [Paracoccus sp. MBLB3053]|uniref:TetR/AcrR family transcriptional regulator C-terminal domain-containing protein n=1 Tax=Paracoccus aurantius TaxID=3073814 RepID=A0ABU2HWS3_9RHOB|nr:TetR/AcrR family transcriptional regulator C-terminal domain-containing protein [Paracoccus sp. MBLB3053]MDS9468754.1 TetR/AcrR family transcriptional regulator C-terminal domain-containing protein [Paracoccus sp. MBLB3053]